LNARAVAAWSAACLFIVLFTTNPAYKALVLAAAIASLAAGAGLKRIRGLLTGVVLIAAFATLLNFVSAHLGATILFALPASIPAVGHTRWKPSPRACRVASPSRPPSCPRLLSL
jgi:hypothetical protein